MMMTRLYLIDNEQIVQQDAAAAALEAGQIIYFPQLAFTLQPNEQTLLSEHILAPKHKNVSYDYQSQRLNGVATAEYAIITQSMMQRYAEFAHQLIKTILPTYQETLLWGRTSYRPAEIDGRITSKRKDDTRLHVDAFPSTPVNGLRILRVFCNINPYQQPRVWQVGEPFTTVLNRFASQLPRYKPYVAKILHWLKTTKTLRSAYDHYMLHLHDRMKLDDHYQAQVYKHQIDFPAQTTWIVFTDHVSHAALRGQFLLEQTFYLPIAAMQTQEHAPLWQWEQLLNTFERT